MHSAAIKILSSRHKVTEIMFALVAAVGSFANAIFVMLAHINGVGTITLLAFVFLEK